MRKKNSTGAFRGSIDRSDVSGGTDSCFCRRDNDKGGNRRENWR